MESRKLGETEEGNRDPVSNTDDERERNETSKGEFMMRPGLRERFRPDTVRDIIHTVLREELQGKIYTESDPGELSKSIATLLRQKVVELGFPRYKYVVQVILGEQIGAGVRTGTRCLWDADSDNYASDVYIGCDLRILYLKPTPCKEPIFQLGSIKLVTFLVMALLIWIDSIFCMAAVFAFFVY